MSIGRWALAAAVLFAAGCGTKVKYFKVTSFPEGATVYVDGEPRGQTNFDRLGVSFRSSHDLVTIRLEKDGYQTTGAVLAPSSRSQVGFFLQKAPKNEEILEVLKGIHQVLDRVSSDLRQSATEGNVP